MTLPRMRCFCGAIERPDDVASARGLEFIKMIADVWFEPRHAGGPGARLIDELPRKRRSNPVRHSFSNRSGGELVLLDIHVPTERGISAALRLSDRDRVSGESQVRRIFGSRTQRVDGGQHVVRHHLDESWLVEPSTNLAEHRN